MTTTAKFQNDVTTANGKSMERDVARSSNPTLSKRVCSMVAGTSLSLAFALVGAILALAIRS